MRPEIIVALDVPEVPALRTALRRLPDNLRWGKVGLELFCSHGPEALEPLRDRGMSIFLDLKLHDIPRTVERAVRSAANHGVHLLTIHACGGTNMMKAAVQAAQEAGPGRPRILAVTVLTSMDAADLRDVGVQKSPAEQVQALAELAIHAGVDGLVCSPQEVGILRARLGAKPLLVTPGIRLPGNETGDQKRIATPSAAAKAGASHLVIGRPILEAADPAEAVRQVELDLQSVS